MKKASGLTKKQLLRALNPPHDNTREVLHGVTVRDPFRPLEKLETQETAAWVKRQGKQFSDYIADATDSRKAAIAFLTGAMNYDLYSVPSRYNRTWFRTYKKGLAAQAHIETAASANGPWKILFDPNRLSKDGAVSLSGWTPSEDGKRLAYFISGSGSHAQTLRIIDVKTGRTLPDTITGCRFASVLWDKNSHDSFQYTYPSDDGTRRLIVKRHIIGQPVGRDSIVFEPAPENALACPLRLRTATYDWMIYNIGTDTNSALLFRPQDSKEPFKEIIRPQKFSLNPVAELKDGHVLAVTNKDAPRGRLVSFNLHDASPKKWKTLIPEHKQDILNSALLQKGKLFAFYTHDTVDVVKVFTPAGKHLHDMPLPPQSVISLGRVNEEDGKFFLLVSGFRSQGDFYAYDIRKNKLTSDKRSLGKYTLDGCIIERLHATSKDGTKVPMTVIRGPKTKLDGTAALKLYGYGGFNVALRPCYMPTIVHFVMSGGIYAQANLRGGGEFGEDWYNQGRGHYKQNVFDDFAACAEYLVRKKYTSPQRLVIEGHSNGGLLTAVVAQQRPELFGAVITRVPVTDMLRFHLASYGAAWKSDYGDPAVKKDFAAALRYSPLHNVKPGAKYPPQLILTSDHDDHVLPWHSFKLAATLQALSHPDNTTLLRVETNTGHGAGKPTAKVIQEEADIFTFIEKAIGPVAP